MSSVENIIIKIKVEDDEAVEQLLELGILVRDRSEGLKGLWDIMQETPEIDSEQD